jgi:invasion protein IalB
MEIRSFNGFWVRRNAAAGCLLLSGLILPGIALAQQATTPQTPPATTQQPSPTAPAPPVSPEQPSATQPPAPGSPPPSASTPPPSAAPANAQPSKTAFGTWTVVCGTPDGGTERRCVLMQSVVSQERPEMQLSVAVSKQAGGKTGLLRVQAPLSVLLPNGLGLYVDGTDIGNAYFARCFSDGCYAEVVLDDTLLGTLRKGSSATFTIFQTQEEGIGIPVDLKGFKEGYDALP